VKALTVSEARRLFAEVLESVLRDEAPVVIVRYRTPVAVVVPVSRLSRAERLAAKRHVENARQRARRS